MRIQKTFVALVISAGALLHSTPVTQAQPASQTAPARSQTAPARTLTLSGLALGASASDLTAAHGQPTALMLGASNNISHQQAPPKPSPLLSLNPLPDWVSAIAPQLDADDVLWLYRHKNCTLAFKVNRRGIVDETLVAGPFSVMGQSSAPSTATQLQSGNGVISLGDEYRKVLSRFGYPHRIQSYPNAAGKVRDFVYSYESVAFTTRNERVVRIHLWPAPVKGNRQAAQ